METVMSHKKIGALVAFVLGTFGAFAIAMASHASADTHICVGGYGDPSSSQMAQTKAAQGDPCDVPIQWPAALGLPNETTNLQGSLNVGVPNTVNAYDAAPPGPVRIEGFSLGSIDASQSGDYITRVRGNVPTNKPLTVITNGNPYGASGIAHDPGIAGLAFDVGGSFLGVPQDVPQQGINRCDVNDVWCDSANQLPQTQIAQAATIPWNHNIPDPRGDHETYVTQGQDGPVQNEIYNPTGEDNPISAAAQENQTPVDPGNLFFDSTFPVNDPATGAPLP